MLGSRRQQHGQPGSGSTRNGVRRGMGRGQERGVGGSCRVLRSAQTQIAVKYHGKQRRKMNVTREISPSNSQPTYLMPLCKNETEHERMKTKTKKRNGNENEKRLKPQNRKVEKARAANDDARIHVLLATAAISLSPVTSVTNKKERVNSRIASGTS